MTPSPIFIFNTSYRNHLKEKLGNQCFLFLEENQVNLFILTQRLLISKLSFAPVVCIDHSYALTPAIKAFEGYLEKLIQEKDLKERKDDRIGTVFGGKKNEKVYTKLKDAKTYRDVPSSILTEWNLCRGRVVHYNPTFFLKNAIEARKKYERILDIIKEGYEAYFEESTCIPSMLPKKSIPLLPKTERESTPELKRYFPET